MKKIIFATNNTYKVAEARLHLPAGLQLLSLADAGINIEIPEPHDSFRANASEKSLTIKRLSGEDCFSEDAGLEVEALGGAPGVRSARYAGEHATYAQNNAKLLEAMKGQRNRMARFIAVISLQWMGAEYFFEGTVNGTITEAPRGDNGFGYDPVFIPDGETRTFAEMNAEEKKALSHRAKAVKQLIEFLQQHYHGQN
jgi:XTP/dITP diphosphohydrolase